MGLFGAALRKDLEKVFQNKGYELNSMTFLMKVYHVI